ncbi:MAG: flagellin [Burkholderiaceae bacterium]|jgi:flagellin|nr:flagellin [Burkholderiaceae bacterium]
MPQIINTNISSLNSQRHLNNSQSALSQAMERLSSGKRINSAKDDAAGLNIAEKMTTQIGGMNQAIRNAYDGVSLGQTAEGALATSGDMLQRIRVLAVQASNATNTSEDRQAIQDEVSQLASELNRIALTTSFNGQKLLDGTMGAQNFQVGANAGEIITANGMNFQTNLYGDHRIKANGATVKLSAAGDFGDRPATDYTAEEIVINGPLGKATITAGTETTTARDRAISVNAKTGDTGVKAQARTEAFFTATADHSHTYLLQSDNSTEVTIAFAVGEQNADGYAQAINAFNAQSSKTGVTAEYDAANGGIKLVNASGNDIQIANSSTAAGSAGTVTTYTAEGTSAGSTALALAAANGDVTTAFVKGVLTFDAEKSYSITATLTANSAFGIVDSTAIAAGAAVGSSKLRAVAELDVTTFDKAQLALAIVDSAIGTINKERARYGALQRRFESTIDNLRVSSENTSNARSRIQDADYAEETAALSRATILQQAGTAMLAQANQIPQTVLSLIR